MPLYQSARASLARAFAKLSSVVWLVTGVAAPATASPPEPACWSEWSDAAEVVERERLAPAKGVHGLTRQRVGGDLVRITLCEMGGAYVYRLLVRDPKGRVLMLTVDARRPFDE